MSSIQAAAVAPPAALDAAALLAGARERVRLLGGQILDGAVDDDTLTEWVEGLHRLETMVHAEKLALLLFPGVE